MQDDKIHLLGLEHTKINEMMKNYLNLDDSNRCVAGRIPGLPGSGLLTIWKIDTQDKSGQVGNHIVRIGINEISDRASWIEKLGDRVLKMEKTQSASVDIWRKLAFENKQKLLEILHRELTYSGIVSDDMSYSSQLLGIFGIET